MDFKLTPKQREVRGMLASGSRHNLLYGGSRSGKTFLICYANAVRAIKASGSRHLIARLHNIAVRQSVMMDTFPKVMRLAFPGVAFKSNKQDQFVTLQNGSEIWFSGLDDKERIDKVLGREFVTISTNEASEVSYAAQETLRTRLAQVVKVDATEQDLPLREYVDLNPTGKAHWTYREFIEGVKPTGEPVRGWEPGNKGGNWRYAVMNPVDNPLLSADYLDTLKGLSQRQRQRFLEGQYMSDVPGALWSSAMLEAARVPKAPELKRIVVAIDPPISAEEGSDECGIVVAGVGDDGLGYILADVSVSQAKPAEWARIAIQAYHGWKADRIVAEANQGGLMVRHTLETVDRNAAITMVHASKGKAARAEPVAALYEQGRVKHVGSFTALEDQMCGWVPGSSPKSPDRMDALVWAITELMIAPRTSTFGSFGRL